MAFDQKKYEAARDKLITNNEGIVNNIYLDTRGIPTAGKGVAFIATPNSRNGHRYTVDEPKVNGLSEVLGLSDKDKAQFMKLMQQQAHNLNTFPRPDYPKGRGQTNLTNFLKSPLGSASEQLFGPITMGENKSFDVLTNSKSVMQIKLTAQQSDELYRKTTIEEKEGVLDRAVLNRVGCPKEALSENQRAALFSMVYHGAADKARAAASVIKQYSEGKISEEVYHKRMEATVLHPQFQGKNNQFLGRSRRELNLIQDVLPRITKHSSLDPNHNLDNFAQTQVATAQLSPAAAKLAEQCEKQLIAFCERNNISATHPDDYKNIAMALTAKGIEARMSRVESVNVALNENSVAIFSHEPDLRYAEMQLDTATKTPAHESTLQVAQAENTLAREQAERQFNQNQSQGRSMV
ncbi:hypothetical protein [Kingella sp. (in: b-proteobacteria)]|uniref:hypothetical protein n=1 Tax=Kingella sp. (in: b-proteobacteria) TaxID=2020713 RepID=UPI0026DC30B3|nr:hypothetical protein [Kingella sp. (in: b-proteobacteria)]MDO4657450.1 hypothetical protein [Kingella sp. (in: b-proteobacteria)]